MNDVRDYEGRDEKPPFLRFAHEAVEDRHASNITGKTEYRNVVKVFIHAAGDNKCEVPAIVRGFGITKELVEREKTSIVERKIQKEDENGEIYFETLTQPETKIVTEPQYIYTETTPWLDKIKSDLRHGRISQNYYDYCIRHFKSWEAKGETPIDGIPIIEWTMISEMHKKKCLDIGINTVQRLAEATEEALANIGMGARDIKKKAIAYLDSSNDIGAAAAKIAALELELESKAKQSQTNSDLQNKIAELEAKLNNKPKRGRPAKSVKDDSINDMSERS